MGQFERGASRRRFLESVGQGMLAVGLGASLTRDLGLSSALGAESSDELRFGAYDELVDLLRSTPADRLQPQLVERLRRGETDLPRLIGAAALANAETFGGVDYVGFHTAMAMLPALSMAELLPSERAPLPILKVLYRNSQQIQQLGGASHVALRALHDAEEAVVLDAGREIRDACRQPDVERAERLFAPITQGPLDNAFVALQPAMQDDINVHRFVFAYRTYGLAKLLGADHAHTILRQCLHFCAHDEQVRIDAQRAEPEIRALVPRLFDQFKLEQVRAGERDPGDEAVEALARTIYQGPPNRAAEATAAALAEGISPEVVGEAISLASNLLVLCQGPDPWRTHGDSRGVHASDATNAWRNMARVATPRLAYSGLIVAAYHVAIHQPFAGAAYPTAEARSAIHGASPEALLDEADDAIRHNDQPRAAAAIALYGEQGHSSEAVFERLLRFTVSEDGRLHGEKYYQTAREEFRTTRPAFRWRQLVALARVTASAYGYDRQDQTGGRAPGYEEACKLLGVPV